MQSVDNAAGTTASKHTATMSNFGYASKYNGKQTKGRVRIRQFIKDGYRIVKKMGYDQRILVHARVVTHSKMIDGVKLVQPEWVHGNVIANQSKRAERYVKQQTLIRKIHAGAAKVKLARKEKLANLSITGI